MSKLRQSFKKCTFILFFLFTMGFKIFNYLCGSKINKMGKGDKRTKKGKIINKSYGNARPQKQNKTKKKS